MSNKSIFYDQKSSLTVKESVVLTFWCRPGYMACRKMACRKMDEDVAYARNTESGCKLITEISTCPYPPTPPLSRPSYNCLSLKPHRHQLGSQEFSLRKWDGNRPGNCITLPLWSFKWNEPLHIETFPRGLHISELFSHKNTNMPWKPCTRDILFKNIQEGKFSIFT